MLSRLSQNYQTVPFLNWTLNKGPSPPAAFLAVLSKTAEPGHPLHGGDLAARGRLFAPEADRFAETGAGEGDFGDKQD